MLRITLDSSTYISALQFNGRAARLLRMAADNDIEIAISEPVIAEVIGVLRERFGWDGYRLHAARERIKSITKFVTPSETLNVIDYDPPDNRISGMCRRGWFRVHRKRGQGFTTAQEIRGNPHYQSVGNVGNLAR